MSTITESPPASPDDLRMVELERDECLELLASQRFGRLITVSSGRPLIRPVNYAFDPVSQSVVFRTDSGAKFRALLSAANAAFETDWFDERVGIGWSVIIHGVVAEVRAPGDIARLEGIGLPPRPPGSPGHWMRIRAWTVSGRRTVRLVRTIPAKYLG